MCINPHVTVCRLKLKKTFRLNNCGVKLLLLFFWFFLIIYTSLCKSAGSLLGRIFMVISDNAVRRILWATEIVKYLKYTSMRGGNMVYIVMQYCYEIVTYF